MFLGETRDLKRTSTALAAEPLHLMPIRDVSTSTYNANWERVDYERLSHMIAHACYKRYLKVREGDVEKGSAGKAEEDMEDDTEGGIIVNDSQLIALQTMAEENNQQEELHETQQDEPTTSLEDEPEQIVTLPQVAEDHPVKEVDNNFQKVLSEFLQGLQDKVRTAEEQNEKLFSHSIRILDSGGQPQFHELIAGVRNHVRETLVIHPFPLGSKPRGRDISNGCQVEGLRGNWGADADEVTLSSKEHCNETGLAHPSWSMEQELVITMRN